MTERASSPDDPLRRRMAQVLESELIARAGARSRAPQAAAAGVGVGDDAARLAHDVWQIAARALGLKPEELDPRENLSNLGVDSIAITEVMARISRAFGISCPPTMFFEAANLEDLAGLLLARQGPAIAAHYAGTVEAAETGSVDPPRDVPAETGAPAWVTRMMNRQQAARAISAPPPAALRAAAEGDAAPIAILSMEGRFARSPNVEALAAHLAAGNDCMEEVPPDRWDWRAVYGDPRAGPLTRVKHGGFTPDVDAFDAAFFNISPREAELMDPQHRLFMECVWHVIEKGGMAPGSLAGRNVALFVGLNLLDYTEMVNRAGIMEAQQLTGIGHAFCPNRLSFLLDLRGPSAVIDTACSSALVAVARAVNAIRHEGCEMAIAGGANLMLSPMQHVLFSQVGMLAADGRCKAFAAGADGYARADGVGAVLLKRLDAAERDGDPILGVIRGVAENHGGGATSLTAPNPRAQADLIVAAHAQAGTDPRSIGMIECHGTGTPLGDPVEVEGLKQAFATLYERAGHTLPERAVTGLGSVKSNIGHTEATAGLAGLIKVLLAMREGVRYRSLHCDVPNPLVDLSSSPFHLLQQAADWPRPVLDGVEEPRRAGLSSFGAGGANVHLVVEEYRGAPEAAATDGPMLVPVSARSEAALRESVAQLAEVVGRLPLAAVAHTLQAGRDAMRHRAVFIARDRADLASQMARFEAGQAITGMQPARHTSAAPLDDVGIAPEAVAAHWAGGGNVDWRARWPGGTPRRIALPGTAFQRKRFWLPLKDAVVAGLMPQAQGGGVYEIALTGGESYLRDHRVWGVPVLPGVAYLELARAVALQEGIAHPILSGIVWMAPLGVATPRKMRCEITANGANAQIEMSSTGEDGARVLHCQMKVAPGGAGSAPLVDLDALRAATPDLRPAPAIYDTFTAMGLEYGPAHRVIAALHVGASPTQVLARLDLGDAPDPALTGTALHPGLLDGALQSAIGLSSGQQAALPFAMDRVEVFGPCEARMWAHLRPVTGASGKTQKIDIDLISDDGTLRVALRGFATRVLVSEASVDRLCFVPEWAPLGSSAPDGPMDRALVVLVGAAPDVPGVAARRLAADPDAAPGARFAQVAGGLLALVQAEWRGGAPQVQLVLEPGDPATASGLGALLRSIHREHPGFGGQVLIARAAEAVHLAALSGAPTGTIARVEAGDLVAETWCEQRAAPAAPVWRNDGVYLITGGTGALGQMLATAIAEAAPGAAVILAGRSAVPGEVPCGPGVHTVRADLTAAGAAARLIEGIVRAQGRLTGVIHAAGVLEDGPVLGKTADSMATVLAPKVAGVEALDAALGPMPLEFLVLYGSISSVLGSAGQADYAAANGYLDGFARARDRRVAAGECHGRTRCIAWPLWRDGGMGMSPDQERLMWRSTGLVPMAAQAGLEALAEVLAGDAPSVMIACGDGARIRTYIAPPRIAPMSAPGAQAQPQAQAQAPRLHRPLLACLVREAGAQLKVAEEDLDPDVELTEYGFDSIGFTQFSNRLSERLGLDLTPTIFFEFPTLEGLTGHLAAQEGTAISAALGIEAAPPEAPPTAPVAPPAPPPTARPEAGHDAIAIIGMSCQFAGAPDLDAFWQVLEEGRDCITEIPPERWDWREIWGDPLAEQGKCNVKWGGFIDGLGAFDAPFFGLSAPEARMMDPQQRLLLTQAWRVMEDAGYAPSTLAGSQTGVFIGTADTGYSRLIAEAGTGIEGYAMTGLAPSLGPNRISYTFDFHGPSVAVETACSSALVAVHRAVEALRAGRCDAAIAGGINALLLSDAFVGFARAGMLSPDGRSKPFSATANGYARGEGVGLVMLKPLATALEDGDRITGVIRASGENHGGNAATLTAPNPVAQAALLRDVYGRAGIDPRSVGYIEAHGTGTPLGDPIEVEALSAAFADLGAGAEARFGPAPVQDCALGSVKSNIGHLELAAGIAGLIKVLLSMRHGRIPASLHCDDLNPYIKLGGTPFRIARACEEWVPAKDAQGRALPRRAGVSSFGFGGSNAHVVLEEWPDAPVSGGASDGPEIIVLSARTEAQLRRVAGDLAAYLSGAGAALCDVAHTLRTAREPMEWRLGLVAESVADLARRLVLWRDGGAEHGVQAGRVKDGRRMTSLLERDPVLREAASGLAARGAAEDLIALWVGGFAVDWRGLGETGSRIPLPGYPFDTTRLWVGEGPQDTPQTPRADVTFDGSESFVRDHVVAGRRVLPGVVAFGLLADAVRRTGKGAAFELVGHGWLRPVDLEDGPQSLSVTIGTDGRYEITARGPQSTLRHAEGLLRPLTGAAPVRDLAVARDGAPEAGDAAALYRRFDAMGLCYGPAQRAISAFWTGADQVLAQLDLPPEATGNWALDPSILDGALQAVLALGGEGLALPYAVRRVAVYGPTEARMWALVRQGSLGATIDLCDGAGQVRVRLEDFTTRAPQGQEAPPEATNAPAPPSPADALAIVTDIAARTLEVAPEALDAETELGDFGFDSVGLTTFAARMNAELGLALTPADFFEFATLARLAAHVEPGLKGTDRAPDPVRANSIPATCVGDPTAFSSEPAPAANSQDDPIVITGQSCLFPMADDVDAFWDNLLAGRDCITRIPPDRWDWRAIDGDPKAESGRTDIHWGGFCNGVFEFDPLFFGISPREARLMDPQQRLMLMHAWKAIEDAGHSPRALAGRRVGVFVGTASSGYLEQGAATPGGDGYVATGTVPSVGPNRISFLLDLHGPSEPVETACSSALVALHRAVRAIEAGDCEMALVGGVNTMVTPAGHIGFSKAGMLAPDGRCKTFSASANGYVRGEGAGMILIRRRSEAERDGDPILAVIRGSGINHGGHANSLTAPNTRAQADLLRSVYARSGIDPRTVGYIEAHGTGTALGDPVEINALKSAFASLGAAEGPDCRIGAVKTNIGHLELAAGIAGVLKVVAQLRHRTLAPSLHCDLQNPYIDLSGSPFSLIDGAEPWEPVRDTGGTALPLRAGVSSFGFGGVNAHAILEEYRAPDAPVAHADGPALIVLSARTESQLAEIARRLADWVDARRVGPGALHDLAFTLQVGRAALPYRMAFVCTSLAALADTLRAIGPNGRAPGVETGHVAGPAVQADLLPGHDLSEAAQAWLAGARMDWAALHPYPRRRLRLPTYPFARDEYRLEGSALAATDPTPANSAPVDPARFALDPQAFYLRDHRMEGQPLLPGAMSIELIRRAVAAERGDEGRRTNGLPLVLTGLTWRRPITAESAPEGLRIAVSPGSEARPESGPEGGQTCRILSADAAGQEFVRAGVHADPPKAAPHLDVAELARACPDAQDPDVLYARYATLGIDYGPGFRVITQLATGESGALAHLRVPAAGQDAELLIHPSVLDGAFHAALVLGEGGGGVALPFAVERIEVLHATGPDMIAHLRSRAASDGLMRLDIDIADPAGKVAVRIEGFSLRVLKAAPATPARASAAPIRVTAPMAGSAPRATIDAYLIDLLARETEIAPQDIALTVPLEEYGIDSILIARLTDVMERKLGPLPVTLFFEHQTLESLGAYLSREHGSAFATDGEAPVPKAAPQTPVQPIAADAPIAIIGLAGRYPGAQNVAQFWQALAQGRDSVTEVPAARWDHARYFDPVRQPGKTTGKWGGFIDGHDLFDPHFFNISPRDAQFMDPQERLFLQCAWETLEDAGYTRARLAAGGDTGVFVGVMYEEYQLYGPERSAAGQPTALTGSAASIANRVSYFCDFHGPSLALDSMCSSSLSALHLACDALRAGSCATALAGGVNLNVHPNKYLALAQGRFLSSKGRCESFGEGGDGYVPAEGVGAVLLKPLERARADGDRIWGVILGSALNHGGKTNGYTVPNPAAQTGVIGAALSRAGVTPDQIGYVEAHGTGTSLGDPIEIAALARAYGPVEAQSCAIGSVKSNIGHAESAAGVAGLTKVLLQLKHRQIAPSLHSGTLNPRIAFAETPFAVQQTLAPWAAPVGGRRIAGLSSFGAGGANAHVIVAEDDASASVPSGISKPMIFPFSARDHGRLAAQLTQHRKALAELPEADLPSAAYTLQEGREAFEARAAVVAADRAGLLAGLDRLIAGEGGITGHAAQAAGQADPSAALVDIAAAWCRGAAVAWAELRAGPAPVPLSLPTYPFAQEKCWLPDPPGGEVAEWALTFAPVWHEVAASEGTLDAPRCLVLCDPAPDLAAAFAQAHVLAPPPGPPDARFAACAAGLMEVLQGVGTAPACVQVIVPPEGGEALLDALAGMLRCAAVEAPTLTCQLIEADATTSDLPARLARDARVAGSDGNIRYVAGRRLVRHWREVPPPEDTQVPWRAGGVYLLTGGAGGIGLHVARAIAASGVQPALWLTGRAPLSPEREAALDALRALGARVQYRAVEMTDRAALAALIDEIEQADGAPSGVFHGAGVVDDGALAGKTAQGLARVLAPKVAGIVALDAAIGARPLDFLALFASAAGAVGNPGQTDYGAANAFLDAFAARRNAQVAAGARHGRCVALDWPYWREGGMTMSAAAIARAERATGIRPLDTAPALAALEAALTGAVHDQLLVLAGDSARLRAAMTPVQRPPQPALVRADVVQAARPPIADTRAGIMAKITAAFTAVTGLPAERQKPDETIDLLGVDSVSALDITALLEADFGPLAPTLLLEAQTIAGLADALEEAAPPAAPGPAAAAAAPAVATTPEAAPDAAQHPEAGRHEIAITALAGRFPGANTIEEFAEALRTGRDGITEVPQERAALIPRYAPRKGQPGTSHCKWGGFLTDIDRFDAAFFGYTPRAADLADPQERLFLQTLWHLFERAGLTRAALATRFAREVGVFVGSMYQQYPGLAGDAETAKTLALTSYAGIANRASFFFDLQGPSVALDSMCSSGLQAVHQACQSLMAGECRLAVAGGVNLSIHPAKYEMLSRAGLVASDPARRAFAGGDGYLPAEAVGAVLLRPLADAQRDGDRVLGVITASRANHAGHSAGYGVPDAGVQAKLMRGTLDAAGLAPGAIGTVEVAATGAQLGDAVELRALAAVFGDLPKGARPALGSVKASIGHAEAASGLAQLVKVVLQLQEGALFPVPSGGMAAALPGTAPLSLQTTLAAWPAAHAPRRAAITSFGAGGSNVALIVEEAPVRPAPPEAPSRFRQFPLSARTPEALSALRRSLAAYLEAHPDTAMDALARTLQHGREGFACAVLFVARDAADLAVMLRDADAVAPCEPLPEAEAEHGPMLVLPGYPFARDRHWLPAVETAAPLPPSPASARADMPPLALVQRLLAQELGRDPIEIGAEETLDSIGADSMARTRLIYEVEEAFGVVLGPADLARLGTPGAIAAHLDAQQVPKRAPRMPRPDPGALSLNQTGLWVVQQLFPRSGDYNVPLAFRGRGLEPAALAQALDWLVARYPLLGVQIADGAEEPAMRPAADPPVLQAAPLPKEIDETAFLRRRALEPFDLSQGVLRAEHFRGGTLDPDESLVLITVHHVVTDGLSSAVIAGAFWEAYGAIVSGKPLPEPEDGADHADFVAWERALLASEAGQAQARYWQARFAAPLPELRLPCARPGDPVGQAPDAQCLTHLLPAALGRRIGGAARALHVTPAALCLAALAVVLHRQTGAEDLIIGVPTLRRPERRFARTIGYCANMIAPRLTVVPAMSFADLARATQGEMSAGLAHGDYPFAAVARELGRSLTGAAPYTVSFAYQSFGAPASDAGGADVTYLPQIRQCGGTGLDIEIGCDGDGHALRIDAGFDAARFVPEGVAKMLVTLEQVLAGMVEDPEARVSVSVPPAPESGREGSAADVRDTGSDPSFETGHPPEKPILTAIVAQIRRSPSAIAIAGGEGEVSYRDLGHASRRIARDLLRRKVRRGDRVAVMLERSPDAVATLLAVLSVGAVWVPLDPDAPPERLRLILADCGARLAVSRGALAGRIGAALPAPCTLIDLDEGTDAQTRRFMVFPWVTPAPGDPAYVIYTSGSTGVPKGVVIPHGALAHHCAVIGREYELTAEDRVLQFAPHSVDTAIEQMLPVLTRGGRLVLRPRALPGAEALFALLCEQGVTLADLPPVYLHEVLRGWRQAGRAPRNTALRMVVVGGEVLPPELADAWFAAETGTIALLNAYGPTEATITALVHRVMPHDQGKRIPIGRPLPGTLACILDPNGAPVPDGGRGELCLGGPRLALGYHGRAKLSAARFGSYLIDGAETRLYRTGDLATVLPGSGRAFAFHGRIDDQVKLRGHRIELGEIEAALLACGMAEAAVLLDAASGEDRIVAHVVPAPDAGPIDQDALRAALATRLPEHMLPAEWREWQALPKTASGKADRQALRAAPPPAPRADVITDSFDPLTARLRALWHEVLGRAPGAEQIAPDARFEDVGGHSLLAVRLLNGIAESFGTSLSAHDLEGAPTLVTQAALLRARGSGAPLPTTPLIVPLRQAAAGATDDAPIFLIHPVGGTLSCYDALVRGLGGGRAIHGIRAHGLEPGEDAPGASIPDMAAAYCAQVQAIAPGAAPLLIGWSLGGIIAHEMAQLRADQGMPVAFLGLIDSYTPAALARLDPGDVRPLPDAMVGRAFLHDVFGADVPLGPGQDAVAHALTLPQTAHLLPGADDATLRRLYTVFSANLEAARRHDIVRLAVPATLFAATSSGVEAADAGWRDLPGAELRVCRVPGDHYTLLRKPFLDKWMPSLLGIVRQIETVEEGLQRAHDVPATETQGEVTRR